MQRAPPRWGRGASSRRDFQQRIRCASSEAYCRFGTERALPKFFQRRRKELFLFMVFLLSFSLFFFPPLLSVGITRSAPPPLSSPCTAHRSCSPLPARPDRSAGESGSSAAWYRLRAARISLQLAIREKKKKKKKERKKKTCEKSSHYLIET